MAEGNGADFGSMVKMLEGVVVALEHARAAQEQQGRDMGAMRSDLGMLKSDMGFVKGDLATLRGDLATLRQDVATYHGSVMGHGIMLHELDERLRRVEVPLRLSRAE